ncbi:hypothetical protein HOY80DRAFT_736124 [Tuber brumale]|nr:hypothetical protein HOY80DRAFT_736124 [Tuber brumale]
MAKKKGGTASGSPEGDLKAPHPEAPLAGASTRGEPDAKRRRCRAGRGAKKRHEASEEKRQEDVTTPTAANGITAKQSSIQMSEVPGANNLQPGKPKSRSKVQDKEGASTKLTIKGPDTQAEEAKAKETEVSTVDQATQTVKTRRERRETEDAATQTEAQKSEGRPKCRKRKRGEYSSSSSSSSSSNSDKSSSNSDDETSSWSSCDEWDDWEREYCLRYLWSDIFGSGSDETSDEDDHL